MCVFCVYNHDERRSFIHLSSHFMWVYREIYLFSWQIYLILYKIQKKKSKVVRHICSYTNTLSLYKCTINITVSPCHAMRGALFFGIIHENNHFWIKICFEWELYINILYNFNLKPFFKILITHLVPVQCFFLIRTYL